MKKNKMMRMASMLLILVLLTTCTISGTFAKYVTTGSASDTARVAKWGVELSVEGELFSDSYKNTKTTYNESEKGATITVQADTKGTNVVAPGTKNTEGITFVLKGKPEVDTKVEIVVKGLDDAEKATDIYLVAGNYKDYTTGDANSFNLPYNYYPVVFTLLNSENMELAKGNLAAIEKYLENLSGDYDANTDLSKIGENSNGTYKLVWSWEFEGGRTLNSKAFTDKQVNQADTVLGNVAAGLETADGNASTEIAFELSITVTQVD